MHEPTALRDERASCLRSSRRHVHASGLALVRILYFADIRFPLERANGIQSMETCHALAGRGHEVHLVVRPDTHTPSRDPFEVLRPAQHGPPGRLSGRRVTGPHLARRLAYLAVSRLGPRASGADAC